MEKVISYSTIIKNKIDVSKYDQISEFHEGLARVKLNGKDGYINKEGKEVIKPIYDFAVNFHKGLARVKLNGKWGYINKDGKIAIKLIYDDVFEFSEDLAAVCSNGKWSYINKDGKEVIKLNKKYERAHEFHNGLAAVCLKGKWGYINKEGKIVIKPIYDDADNFHKGLAQVKLNGNWSYINKEGKNEIRLNGKDDYAYDSHKGLVLYPLNGKCGVMDKEGNKIIDCCFESIKISDGMIIFDKKYIVDVKTMELAYLFKLSLNNKTIEKEFNDRNKRDEYVGEIEEYLKKMETEKNNVVDIFKKILEEQINSIENSYVDDALEMANSYYKKYQD